MAVNISKTKYIIFRTKGKKIDRNCDKIIFNELGAPNNPDLLTHIDRIYTDNPDPDNNTSNY